METMAWKDEYCIGIEEIDRQHMDFVRLMNRFVILFESGSHIKLQDRILLEIHKYAEYHFVSEENLMMMYHYPSRDVQEKAHQALLKILQHKCIGLKEGSVNGTDVIKYFLNWFLRHTQEEDRKLAKYINEEKANA
jgi:hemerythrin